MVADAQRKTAGQGRVAQAVEQTRFRDALGVFSHTEYGNRSGKSRREANFPILYHRCHACTKVFQLDRGSRPYQTSLEKKMDEEMPANTETLSKKMTQDRPIGMPEGLPDGFPES